MSSAGCRKGRDDTRRIISTARLAPEGCDQLAPVNGVVRVVALELVVFPQRLEVRCGASKQASLCTLGQLDRPFQPTCQRRAGEVRAPNVSGPEAGLALEQPGFRVEPCAPTIERDTHLATRQPRQFVKRTCFGGTGVCRRQDANACGDFGSA